MKELEDKVTVLKERGNTHFKKQAYKEAIKQFSEAINMHDAAGSPLSSGDLKLKITQLYTNRCLAFHHLNQQASALGDANYVLTKLDAQNAKALYRRAHCYKTQNKWEQAMTDLQALMKENPSDDIKKDISECLKKVVESRKKNTDAEKKKAEEAAKKAEAPKVAEVKLVAGVAKTVKIEEGSSDSDDDVALEKLKAAKKGKTKQIDEATLQAAKAKASEIEREQAMQQVPKTASGFEKDFNALKKDPAALLKYLSQIPLSSIESYFKKTEIQYELLSGMLEVLVAAADQEWVGKLLISLSKADNFDMTLMFVEDKEKKFISQIVDKMPESLKA